MSARNDLLECYQQWRRWTEAEGDAIKRSDWTLVARCQQNKSQLKPVIVRFTEQTHVECKALGLDLDVLDREVRAVIRDLIVLETRNAGVLADQREVNKDHRAELDRSERNLQRVKHSYRPVATVAWESYS